MKINELLDKWIAEARAIGSNPDSTLEDCAKARTLLNCAQELIQALTEQTLTRIGAKP